MIRYNRAIWKFNNGNGALLCNRCGIIVATGSEHEDIEHYCRECKSFAGKRIVASPDAFPQSVIDRLQKIIDDNEPRRRAIRVEDLSDDEMRLIMDAKLPPEADYDYEDDDE